MLARTRPASSTISSARPRKHDEQSLNFHDSPPQGRCELRPILRYAPKPIVIGDEAIGDLRVTGTVVGNNVSGWNASGWVASLESALGIEAIEEPDRIVLRKAPRESAVD